MCTKKVITFVGALLLTGLISDPTRAAQCADVWPARDTENTSVTANLPTFTGTSAMTLPRSLGAGDFHFSATSDSTGDLTVTGGASTRVFINGNLTLDGSVDLNPGGNPEDLIIVVDGDIYIGNANFFDNIDISAILYATGYIYLSGDVDMNGAATAEGTIYNPWRINFDAGAVANADFGSLCGSSAPVLNRVSLECGRNDRVIVNFSAIAGQEILNSSAEITANYSLATTTGTPITILDAELADIGYDVILTLDSALVEGTAYSLTVSNISDELGNTLAATTADFYYTATEAGIVGAYYNNATLTAPITEYRRDTRIDFSWDSFETPFGTGTGGFSMRWRGYLEPPADGDYQFRSYTDDGVRLWLGDPSAPAEIDNWTDHSATFDSGSTLTLTGGQRYPIRLEYYNRSANFEFGEMRLDWRINGGSYQTVPASAYYTCQVAPTATNGLVVEYRLEGPTWNGTAGEVLDTSGLGVHGRAINGAVSSPARVCNGAELDGSNFLRIPDHASLDLSDELTVTAWIYLEQLNSGGLRSILSKDENYEFHIRDDRSIYWWWNSNGGTRSFDTGSTRISLNTWHHVAVVYADGRQSIYLDGTEVAFETYSGETLVTNADPLEVGADQGLADRNWVGQLDEIKIFKQPLSAADINDIMNETRPCPSTLDNFLVSGPTNASVCGPATITVTARQSDGSTYTGYTGLVDLSTSAGHGNWSLVTANGNLTPNPDTDNDGTAQYEFVAADNGTVQLGLSNAYADALQVNVVENGGSASGVSNAITFNENALVIEVTDPWGMDMVAGRNHGIRVTAVGRADSSSAACATLTDYNGSIGLKAWVSRSVLDPAGTAPTLNGSSGAVSLPDAEPGSGTNLSLDFNSGVADTQWITTDVGQYSLQLKDDSSGIVVDTNNNPLPVVGSSATWTVRPFAFYLNPLGNPGAVDANGGAYVRAGEDFTLNVTAVRYQAADDTDGDHQADAGADLSDNAVTPAFGNEGGGSTESVSLTGTLQLPTGTGTNDPGLAGGTTVTGFSGGSAGTAINYPEVGIIDIQGQLADGSYLGMANVLGQVNNVGRFYPASFAVSDNGPISLRDGNGAWSCGFTYQGQDFGFTLEPAITVVARNLNGDTTQNYGGNFWKLALLQHSISLDLASVTGTTCETAGAITSGCFSENSGSVSRSWNNSHNDYDGAATFSTGLHQLTINKLNPVPNSGDVPFSPSVSYSLNTAQLTDTDGACYDTGSGCGPYSIGAINGTEIRWGRGWVDNAVGSILTPLPMTLRLQYWNSAQQFQLNPEDDFIGCAGTAAITSDMALSGYSGQLSAGETAPGGIAAQPGFHVLTLTAPGYGGTAVSTANTGSVRVTWNLDAWLRYDFDGDGTLDAPSGVATFVGPADNQPVLFRREVFR